MRAVLLWALLVATAACGGSKNPGKDDVLPSEPPGIDSAPLPRCTPVSGTTVSVRRIAFGCGEGGHPAPPMCMDDAVLLVTSPPNDGRLFAVSRSGLIRVLENETLNPNPFLDLSADAHGPVLANGEQGLLGLAFHPHYATNGKFYVFYTANSNGGPQPYLNIVAEYTGGRTDPNKADPASGKIILSIDDPFANHNGGMIEFGSDGYLYIGTGDGGSAGDPLRNGQNTNALLGKILRIDVDHPANGKQYGIPSDNPFAAGGGAGEVFIYGVRNPWRWSFDRGTGDMWIGDVGQNILEELDVLPAGQQAGRNLGWSAYEANVCCANQTDHCSQTAPYQSCTVPGMVLPLDIRNHNTNWNAIIGGQVYRGTCYPDLVGKYFYSDNGNGGMSTAVLQPNMTLAITDLTGTFPGGPASIHADARGELYEGTVAGGIWHIEAGP
jgi:glucose/arabinose dehydrogenase